MPVPLRRKARELALQALYQSEFNHKSPDEALELLCENFNVNKKAKAYAQQLLSGVLDGQEELNSLIEAQANNWRLDRMSLIDRNIMRICAFELTQMDDVPASVAINEALEIAKKFSTDDAPLFINGVLDAISRKLNKE